MSVPVGTIDTGAGLVVVGFSESAGVVAPGVAAAGSVELVMVGVAYDEGAGAMLEDPIGTVAPAVSGIEVALVEPEDGASCEAEPVSLGVASGPADAVVGLSDGVASESGGVASDGVASVATSDEPGTVIPERPDVVPGVGTVTTTDVPPPVTVYATLDAAGTGVTLVPSGEFGGVAVGAGIALVPAPGDTMELMVFVAFGTSVPKLEAALVRMLENPDWIDVTSAGSVAVAAMPDSLESSED